MSKTYDHDKLIEDQEVGIRGMYQDNGYLRLFYLNRSSKTSTPTILSMACRSWARPKVRQ